MFCCKFHHWLWHLWPEMWLWYALMTLIRFQDHLSVASLLQSYCPDCPFNIDVLSLVGLINFNEGWRKTIDQEPIEDQGFLHLSSSSPWKINAWNALCMQSHTIIGEKMKNRVRSRRNLALLSKNFPIANQDQPSIYIHPASPIGGNPAFIPKKNRQTTYHYNPLYIFVFFWILYMSILLRVP